VKLVEQRFGRPITAHSGGGLSARALEIAVRGDLAALKQLLRDHPELIDRKSGGHNRTLLWAATRHGRRESVEFLVERGADVNVPGRYAHETVALVTPYCLARLRRDGSLSSYFLTQGATVDVYRAAYLGDKARVEACLRARPDLVNTEDPAESVYYATPLAYAVAGGHRDVIELLIERGARVTPYSRLLFDFAARSGHAELAEMLLAHGADAREAAIGAYIDQDPALVARLIKRGADVNAVAHHGWPPIVYLSRGDKGEHPERIQALLALGADVNIRGPRGRTALHCAAKAGFLRVIQVLLDHGADIDVRMDDGTTPLRAALRARRTEAANLLRKHGTEE
jgi:ankyrin repeat protein